MDTLEWKGFRFTERWQHLYSEFVEGRWASLLARLEKRDQLLEDHLKSVPKMIGKGKAIIDVTVPYTATGTAATLCSVTLPLRPGDFVKVGGVFDINLTAGGATAVGTLLVDAAEKAEQAILKGASGTRATVYQHWGYTATAVGDVTFALQGRYAVAGVQFTAHTVMRWELYR